MKRLERSIKTAAEWIAASRHLVAFTGAGISTDSGIPDYRGPDGVWTRRDAGLPPPRWKTAPDLVAPNPSHVALVDLEKMGVLAFLISQNVDNLHLASGFPSEKLVELHGNGTLMRCQGCDRSFSFEAVGWDRAKWGKGYQSHVPKKGQPACPSCEGRLVSSVVNFDDPLWETDLERAEEHSKKADVFLVLGSSLRVTPASLLPGMSMKNGGKVILVNRGETPYDERVQLRIEEGIGEVLPPIVERVRALRGKPGR